VVLPALVLVAGAALGYFGSRSLRRPEKAATAASVARNVGGALGRRRGLDAPDLQRACFSEMIRHVEVRPTGVAVPERFVIRLHPDDAATVDEGRRWFLDGLQEALRQAARANGWHLDTEPVIEVDADRGRRRGVPGVTATLPAPPPKPQRPPRTRDEPPKRPTAALVRTDTGARLPLKVEAVTIGRSSDATIRVDDSRVSRQHALIRRDRRGWLLSDEGSSNGTVVGKAEVAPGQRHLLRDGDLIEVGPVGIRYVEDTPAGPGPEPGTQRLDEDTATRISQQVFGPDSGPVR
jgi:hypothetical protein